MTPFLPHSDCRGAFGRRLRLAGFTCWLLGALAAAVGAAAAPRQPNIVFILADDLGYGDVSCYGRPDFRTPAIDRIAESGVRFTQAYANSPVCSPTRVALMTGRYHYRLPIGLEEPLTGPQAGVGLPPEHPTLPSLLQTAGYRTMLIGKWHLGFPPSYGPLRSGYERFYGFLPGATDFFQHGQPGRAPLWSDTTRIEPKGYLTDLIGQRTVEAIHEYADAGSPFLISLHFNAPHWPWEGPGDEAESKRLLDENRSIFHWDGGSQQTYREMVEAMDRQVGRVMAALEERGLAENTIVVFTSDNGGERFSYNWPFTGLKAELLEGGLRVPAIISWPARIPAGVTSEQVMITMDWVPTLLAAAGTAPAEDFPSDGLDLLPQLTGDAAPVGRRLFWRFKANAQEAVRDGDLKFLKINENTFLFDLASDPRERANLKDRRPEDYRRLSVAWSDWQATMLPISDTSFSHASTAAELADHIGARAVENKPVPPPAGNTSPGRDP